MKTLNLVYPEKSDIKYKISKFPSGLQNIVLNAVIHEFYGEIKNLSVTIKSRLNNWLNLELIVASVASLRNLGVKEIHLYIPLIDGRGDRVFEEGSNNYLKQVICPIINSLSFESVTCIDPHSYVLEACLNGFRGMSNLDLVRWVMMNPPHNTFSFGEQVWISPDAGASHKIYKLAEQIGYKGDVITCTKERDTEGKLSNVYVPLTNSHVGKDLIIIDDICDGGTFINIAKAVDEYQQNYKSIYGKKYLIITHGILSKGFEELNKYFDGIYCTNSYNDLTDKNGASCTHSERVKQLNVF